MASAAKRTTITPEEYLAGERLAPHKSEYRDGQLYAMSGASRHHNLIAANLARHLGNQVADRACELYVSEMRVRIREAGSYVYPDLVIACGEPRFEDDVFDTLLNPSLIVEILSPSTESWDRGGKFEAFRRLPSLGDYVLVSQDRVLVESYARQGDRWLLTEARLLDETLPLASVGCDLAIREVYHKVPMPGA